MPFTFQEMKRRGRTAGMAADGTGKNRVVNAGCARCKNGMLATLFSPRLLLRLEGAAIAMVAAALFYLFEGNWIWFALFFLAPDLAALGYLRGPRMGAGCYNLAHNLVLPLALGAIFAASRSEWLPALCIWVAHIGADRLCGYGLKDPNGPAGAPRART